MLAIVARFENVAGTSKTRLSCFINSMSGIVSPPNGFLSNSPDGFAACLATRFDSARAVVVRFRNVTRAASTDQLTWIADS
jgi:hypothetical protein